MDFNTFVITGPSTLTSSLGWILAGNVNNVAGIPYNLVTSCQTDTFSITGVPGGNPPVICGTNSGYHGNYIILGIMVTNPRNHGN
jgi:hypothetical protein